MTEEDKENQGEDWDQEYIGESKKKKKITLSPQVLALRNRSKAGLKPSTSKDTAHRVETIKTEMNANRWSRDKYRYYQKLWQLSRSRISQIAAEASRMSAAEVTNPKVVTETVATTLARKIAEADELSSMVNMRAEAHIHKYPDSNVSVLKDSASMFSAINQMSDTWSRVVGARAPELHEINTYSENYNGLSPEQKIIWLDDKIHKLQTARSKILQESSITTDNSTEDSINGGNKDGQGIGSEPAGPGTEHPTNGSSSTNGYFGHHDKE